MTKNAILSKNFKRFTFLATVLVVSLVLGNFVFAVWTEPSADPPGNNASAPINVSTTPQTKPARLDVSSLYDADDGSYYINPSATLTPSGVFAGYVGIGTTNPLYQLQLEGDSGNAAEILLKHNGVSGSAGITFNVANDPHNFSIHAFNDKLSFFTNDGGPSFSNRMNIMPNGRIGIGTENPLNKLHVVGNTDDLVPTDARISIENKHDDSEKSELCFRQPDTGAGAWCIGTDFWAQNDDDFFIWGGGADGGGADGRFYIDSTGNVGIGTNNPQALLHVQGDPDIGHDPPWWYDGEILFEADVITARDSSPTIKLETTNWNGAPHLNWKLVGATSGGADGKFFIKSYTDAGVISDRFVIDGNNGRVGIGMTNPSAKLEVNGNIKVTGGSFIDDGTTLTVPDYVFDSEYDLKSLSEVEKFVLENKHLKGLPDMDDTEGWAELSMQDRDMKLLEKIEELTLYIIELEKRVDELD